MPALQLKEKTVIEYCQESEGRQHELGQFLTADPVAGFMASMFQTYRAEWNLLDAGAGGGALSAAVVHRLCAERRKPRRITITAYEIDQGMHEQLHRTYHRSKLECE